MSRKSQQLGRFLVETLTSRLFITQPRNATVMQKNLLENRKLVAHDIVINYRFESAAYETR